MSRLGRKVFERGEDVYNFKGVRRYKDKYDPVWQARYIAAANKWSITVALADVALLPVAVQLHQPGHEIEGPMAVVILGGLVSSTLVSLLLVPPLAARWLRPG